MGKTGKGRNGKGAEIGKAMLYRDALLRIGVTTTEKRIFDEVCRTLGFETVGDLLAAAKRRWIFRIERDGSRG